MSFPFKATDQTVQRGVPPSHAGRSLQQASLVIKKNRESRNHAERFEIETSSNRGVPALNGSVVSSIQRRG